MSGASRSFPLPAQSGSGLPSNILSKTTTFTAAAGDFIEADATSAGFTVTLPSAPATGALVAVKKVDSGTNTVTIAPAGSGTIDGDATATTSTEMAGAIFEHVGSDVWRIVASMSTTGPAGTNGTDGVGVPDGGTTGQVLAKASDTDQDTEWADAAAGGGGGGGLLPRGVVSGRYFTMPGTAAVLNMDDGYEFAFPFEVFASTTYTKIGLNVNTLDSAAAIHLGVRQDASGVPGTLVAEGATTIDASVATGTTGLKEVNFAQTLAAGVYWLVARASGGTPNVSAMVNLPVVISSASQAGAMTNICSGYNNGGGGSGALPSSWGATYAHQVTVPRIVLKTA